MESTDVNLLELPQSDPASWFWLIFLIILLGLVLFGILSFTNITEVASNWAEYRCNPLIMPFASLYGYDTAANFNYCVGNIFQGIAPQFTGPFSSILQVLIGSMMTIMSSLNSFRLVLATLMGGITTVFQEIVERFTLLMNQFVLTAAGVQRLMSRMFATFYSIIYMGSSGLQAGINFSNTFLFSFLDTFCFDPRTLIEVKGKGRIFIQDVELGDILSKEQKVISKYQILANGQSMVNLSNINVSANHYVRHPITEKWIRSDEHPLAKKISNWNSTTPLICLDTDTHEITIGGHVFSDYIELDSTDNITMKTIQDQLNNNTSAPLLNIKYAPGLEHFEDIIMKNGSTKYIHEIRLNDNISTGKVYGIVKRLQSDLYIYKDTCLSGSTLVWCNDKWKRVCELKGAKVCIGEYIVYHLLVLNSGIIETPSLKCRDFMELHSPDIEKLTSDAMLSNVKCPLGVGS